MRSWELISTGLLSQWVSSDLSPLFLLEDEGADEDGLPDCCFEEDGLDCDCDDLAFEQQGFSQGVINGCILMRGLSAESLKRGVLMTSYVLPTIK